MFYFYCHIQISEWNKNDEKLSEAVDHGEINKVVPLLTKKGVNPTKLDPKGQTALVKLNFSIFRGFSD